MASNSDLLVVDDSAADRLLIRKSFEKCNTNLNLVFCESGQKAIDLLSNRGGPDQEPRPVACILDFKMPGVSGLDVLSWIKTHPRMGTLPVFMLSGSDNNEDVGAAYAAGVNLYIQKAQSTDALDQIASTLSLLLENVIRLPPEYDAFGKSAASR